ncbi:MAG: POTRA domain-containing protein [Cytophagales bacterium]|nr:POTRA domain-containing protein [Cytophagales bacterium]
MRRLGLLLLFIQISLVVQGQLLYGQNRRNTSSGPSINYSSPKEYEIAGIEVQGVEFLDNNALISLSGLKVGDKIKIPGDEVSSAITKLWKQGIIGDINIKASKIEGSQIYLVIELTERPRLTRYLFKGLNKTQESEVEDDLELVRGKVLTDVVIKNAELTVRKYLEGKGFRNADIRVSQQPDTLLRNSAILSIDVDRGKKVRVENIAFEGNEAFTSAKLRKKLKNTGVRPELRLGTNLLGKTLKLVNPVNLYNFMTHKDSTYEISEYLAQQAKVNVFKTAKYIESDFKDDKDGLLAFYNSKGYRDARILNDTLVGTDGRSLEVRIAVEEGQKYYFRNISWEGNFVHDDEILKKILAVEKGDVYDLDLINQKLNFNPAGADISSLYMDNGYLFFSVNPVEIGIEGDSIDVEMRIYEGAQATIDQVYITGNDKTNDHVILREIRTLPGQKFSRAELIRTQQELSQLGYFDPEQVNPIPKPNPVNETVDIEWSLVERHSDQIEMSGGWGGAFGFIGTLGLTFNNFSMREALALSSFPPAGDGQRLSLRLQANGRRFQSYSLGFTEPWLGGKRPNSFGINLSHSVQRSVDPFTDRVFGALKVTGVTLSLGRRLTWPDDFFTLSNSVGFLQYSLQNFGNSLGFSTGNANSVTFNTTIARNSVSNPMYPRGGSSISLNVAATPPHSLWRDIDYDNASNQELFKWLEYHKWNLDTKYYLQLADKLVLATRAHFGFIGTYNKDVDPGPFERFTLGGDGLTGQNFLLGTDVIGLRGYTNNSITPVENGIRGGLFFTKFVTEIRYPLSLNPSATIYALAFVEGGNNWNDFDQYNPYDMKRSAGFGARIFMPAFGLLGLDWGYGFDNEPGQTGPAGPQFHFSIGQQIR